MRQYWRLLSAAGATNEKEARLQLTGSGKGTPAALLLRCHLVERVEGLRATLASNEDRDGE